MRKEIEIGDLAKDSVTGLIGVVVCKSTWLNGSTRMTLQPRRLDKGSPLDQQTFDAPALILVRRSVVVDRARK